MTKEVEIASFDLRYESYRMKMPVTEKALLTSVLENGIRDPLQGVDSKGSEKRILLNGFKRYRCAKKLAIKIVPYHSLGDDEVSAIIKLIRIGNSKNLTILEQAKLIDELKKVHQLSVAEMARLLEKSKGWVSMRLGMIKQMSEVVMEKIFKGQFPAYSYMYSLRPFMRMNEIKNKEIDDFVNSVGGNGLSVRDIDTLAQGYFKGGDDFRHQIENGNISWALDNLKEASGTAATGDCTELEKEMLKILAVTQKYMQKAIIKSKDERLKSNSFHAQANLLAEGILKQLDGFSSAIRRLHDKTGQT